MSEITQDQRWAFHRVYESLHSAQFQMSLALTCKHAFNAKSNLDAVRAKIAQANEELNAIESLLPPEKKIIAEYAI